MSTSARGAGRGKVWARAVLVAAAFAVALTVPGVVEACPVCYGDIGGPAARGVNNGILTMLGVVLAVQLGFVGMFVGMWRRSRRLRERKEAFKVIDGGAR